MKSPLSGLKLTANVASGQLMMGISSPFGVETQLVAVERQAGLETQRVAGAETDGHGARGDECVPEGRPELRRHEQLEADRLARVAGAADASLDGERCAAFRIGHAQRRDAELVAERLGQGAGLDETGEDVPGLLALQGQHRDLAGLVGELHVGEPGEVVVEVLPVLDPVGGIDHEEVRRHVEAVEVGIVHGAARGSGHDGVLRLQRVERLGVVGEHVLEKGHGAGAAKDEASHVADVEEAGSAACREVLVDDARRVLDRHVPAAEVDHAGAERHVTVVEGSALERARGLRLLAHASAHAFSLPSPSSIRGTGMPE